MLKQEKRNVLVMTFLKTSIAIVASSLLLLLISSCSSGVAPLSGGLERKTTASSPKSGLSDTVDVASEPETNAKAGKASDDDEGIPGYFREMPAISARMVDDDTVLITAPAETVKKLDPQVFLNVWYVDRQQFSNDQRVISDAGRVSAIQVGSVMANMDGAFRFEVAYPANADDILVVAIDNDTQPESMDFIVDDFAIFGGFLLNKNRNSGNLQVKGVLTSNLSRMQDLLGMEKTQEILNQNFETSKEQKKRKLIIGHLK